MSDRHCGPFESSALEFIEESILQELAQRLEEKYGRDIHEAMYDDGENIPNGIINVKPPKRTKISDSIVTDARREFMRVAKGARKKDQPK